LNHAAFTYIVSNKSHRLYVGATTDLIRRVREHKEKRYPGAFTARYNFDRLVWYEAWPTYDDALVREQVIKGWTRAKKVALIQANNPNWPDLSAGILDALLAR
jgi:putative endonuclease